MHSAILLVLGAGAGIVTTTAGMGGGMVLLVGLSLVFSPSAALACTAPALLFGNLHRLYLYRGHVDRRIAVAFSVGALPGALAGGLLAVRIPAHALSLLILVSSVLALSRALCRWTWRVPLRALAPAGLVVGGLTAASGGAGVLVAPLFLATGLVGDAYVGTLAASAALLHVGRLAGYGAGGLLDATSLGRGALIALAIPVGNVIGKRLALRERLPAGVVEHATLATCVALAALGVGR